MGNQIEFAVFCIENIALRLQQNPAVVYEALTDRSDILNNYILPNYEILSTQSKDYIVDDIIDVMREENLMNIAGTEFLH